MEKKKTNETEASVPSDISKPLKDEGDIIIPEEKQRSEYAREIDTEILNKIAEECFSLIKNVDVFDESGIRCTDHLQALVRRMKKEQLAVIDCEIIFSELLAALEKLERIRINEDYEQPSLELQLAQSYIKETKQAAIDYFYNIIKPYLPEDLTERYVYLKKELDYHDKETKGWYPFYVEALNKLKKETDKIKEDIKDTKQFRVDVQVINPVKAAEEEISRLGNPLTQKENAVEILKGSTRQQIFLLLILLFGKLEIPPAKEDMRTQIIDFIVFVTGKHRQNVKEVLQNPTKYVEGNRSSRNNIIANLRTARTYLRSIDSNKADIITREAKSILDIEAEELEEPKIISKKTK